MRWLGPWVLGWLALTCAGDSRAIGDSGGGCSPPTALIETAAFGTPDQMNVRLQARLTSRWDALEPSTRKLIGASADALRAWQAEIRREFLDDDVPCNAAETLLDHAVANGNIDVVRWMLDAGADPSGAKPGVPAQTVFSRCRAAQTRRPDGMAGDEVARRAEQALRLLIARGAQVNRVAAGWDNGPENALSTCRDDAKIPVLLALGADRSPVLPADRRKLAPLQYAVWEAMIGMGSVERVRLLSRDGLNDLRGTRIEQLFKDFCGRPDYVKRCAELAPLVRFSPGIVAQTQQSPVGGANRTRGFSSYREVCTFPELAYEPDYDFAVVGAADGRALGMQFDDRSGEAHRVDLVVNQPRVPVLLYLQATQSTLWAIRRTPGTRIVGVVVAKSHDLAHVSDRVHGLEPETPVHTGRCSGWVHFDFRPPRMLGVGHVVPDALDPFLRKDNARLVLAQRGQALIGEPLARDTQVLASPEPSLAGLGMQSILPSAQEASATALQGRAALDDMVAKGILERGSATVFVDWMKQANARTFLTRRIPVSAPPFWDSYVSRKNSQLVLPGGMKGPDAPTIFVKDGTQLVGDPGDATIFYLPAQPGQGGAKAGTCAGPRCR